MLLIISALFASQAESLPADFGAGWGLALVLFLTVDFVEGIVLDDYYDVVKAVLLSIVVALAFSMPLVVVFGISMTITPNQGYAEAVFFGFLSPALVFLGILVGIFGASVHGSLMQRIPVALTRRGMKVVFISALILGGASGLYEYSVLAAPNFSVIAPASLAGHSTCPQGSPWTSCPIVTIPFALALIPIRGYAGPVRIVIMDNNYLYPIQCSPSSLNLPSQTSSSCQIAAPLFQGEYWIQRIRATDGSVTHESWINVTIN